MIRATLFGLLLLVAAPAFADDWLPVSPEELQMKSEPKAPTASAVFLYRQVDRDDNWPEERVYARIKVLTEDGRKYANVKIPYLRDGESIRNLKARVVRADGTAVDFDGTVYDTPLVATRDYGSMAKSFILPDVEVGSILEYRYLHVLRAGLVFDSRWLLSEALFTRHAVFSLKPYEGFTLRWSWPIGLPAGTEPPKKVRGQIQLETHDVPAFIVEEYSPPDDVLKFRVDFIYDTDERESDPNKYWLAFGKRIHSELRRFVKDGDTLAPAVAQIVQPEDSPETRVRKIYARIQQLRNLSFERSRTAQEIEREHLAENGNVLDVWRHGYGSAHHLDWLFFAMVHAAGIDVQAVLVPPRDNFFFDPKLMNSRQLVSRLVIVKLGEREIFLDPGTPFTPFGLLPWNETGVTALRLDRNGGSWIETPLPAATQSRVERKVDLKLVPTGSLEGKVTVTYTGIEASRRRLLQRHADDTARTQLLERDLQADVPVGIEQKLVNAPDWTSSETPLVAEFDLKVPGWASSAGKRMLLPVGLFGAGEKHTFEHGARTNPLYFSFPRQYVDDVSIDLPDGWRVASIPGPRTADLKLAKYTMSSEAAGKSLKLRRELTLNLTLVDSRYYGQVRDFYQSVRAGDEDQAVVLPGAALAQD